MWHIFRETIAVAGFGAAFLSLILAALESAANARDTNPNPRQDEISHNCQKHLLAIFLVTFLIAAIAMQLDANPNIPKKFLPLA